MVDYDFLQLKSFLELIDTKLVPLYSDIQKTANPDSDGLCDTGEYFLGFGFVAIQRYINATCSNTKVKKPVAIRKGSKINDSTYLAEALDAGANYFKHEPEWPLIINRGEVDHGGLYPLSIDKSGESLEKFQKKTLEIIAKVTPYGDYTLSNLLADINRGMNLGNYESFSPLLPFLAKWRDALIRE